MRSAIIIKESFFFYFLIYLRKQNYKQITIRRHNFYLNSNIFMILSSLCAIAKVRHAGTVL